MCMLCLRRKSLGMEAPTFSLYTNNPSTGFYSLYSTQLYCQPCRLFLVHYYRHSYSNDKSIIPPMSSLSERPQSTRIPCPQQQLNPSSPLITLIVSFFETSPCDTQALTSERRRNLLPVSSPMTLTV